MWTEAVDPNSLRHYLRHLTWVAQRTHAFASLDGCRPSLFTRPQRTIEPSLPIKVTSTKEGPKWAVGEYRY
jgi:hypothetical protein